MSGSTAAPPRRMRAPPAAPLTLSFASRSAPTSGSTAAASPVSPRTPAATIRVSGSGSASTAVSGSTAPEPNFATAPAAWYRRSSPASRSARTSGSTAAGSPISPSMAAAYTRRRSCRVSSSQVRPPAPITVTVRSSYFPDASGLSMSSTRGPTAGGPSRASESAAASRTAVNGSPSARMRGATASAPARSPSARAARWRVRPSSLPSASIRPATSFSARRTSIVGRLSSMGTLFSGNFFASGSAYDGCPV